MSNKCFQTGLQFYKAGNYQEALKCLNEAMESGRQDKFILYDTRAAVHAKLGQYKNALKDAKKTIDLAPDRFHGYARAARAFLACRNASAAQKMVTMALERLKETETERRAALVSLQADVQQLQVTLEEQRIRSIDHIGKLPIEMFGEIARILVDEDHANLIVLLHICKRWRRIIEDDPFYWSKLVLTKRRPKPKAKLWIARSKGRVKDLVVRAEAVLSSSWSEELFLGLKWDQLRFCSVEQWNVILYLTSIGQQLAIANWKGLELHSNLHVSLRHIPIQPASLALQHLSLEQTCIDMEKEDYLMSRVSELRSLSVRLSLAKGRWSDFFRRNSQLESLRLETVLSPSADFAEALQLERLTSLELANRLPFKIQSAELPQLRVMRLRSLTYSPMPLLEHLFDTNVPHLTELQVHACVLDDTAKLIALLGISTNLQGLEITNVTAGVASIIEALAAHYIPPPSRSRFPTEPKPGPVICPKLSHVNFSGCPEVQTGPLLRLIKSRLPEQAEQLTTSEVARIQVARIETLVINSCPNVAGDWLPQIRELVPNVSCMYITKAQARTRRV